MSRRLLACSPLHSTHLGELAVSEPLQPPHAVAGLPLAGGPPGDHDARPPGETLNLPPHQLADAKAFVVLLQGGGGREEEEQKTYNLHFWIVPQGILGH